MTTVAPDADVAAPLDALLVQAARGPYRRFVPDASTAKFAGALLRHPRRTGQRVGDLARELGRIGAGTSTTTPSRRDRRFTDPAWTQNPLLRRLAQGYLATGQAAQALVADADLGWRDAERVGFLVENLVEALAPSNVPLVNPSSAKAAIDTGGLSLVRGGSALVRDLASAPRVPEMVDGSGFRLGENVAATPGDVVHRTEHLELIRYRPQTDTVRSVPLMIVPPTINKYYALDLAPGRSLVEFLVGQGQQVFIISWRNPDARHADWGLDAYVQAVLDTLVVVRRIAGTERTALAGVCSGGIIAALAAARLAATGDQDRLAAFTLLVTVLDARESGTTAALVDDNLAAAAKAESARRGFLDGRALAEVFAWLRPGDLIWNYWVNNYLLGRKPPAFDILFWNADTTRMPARLHADFVDFSRRTTPVDLSGVSVDAYLVAGSADHITPWTNCYRSTAMLGGNTRFVLSTSGHIAALVNPPTNPKASHQIGEDIPADPQEWLDSAQTRPGSWWPDYAAWLGERCGPERPAADPVGIDSLAAAPGTYIFEK